MRLEELRARIRTTSELHGIVSTMRALAQTRLQQAQRALGNFRRYADAVERALGRGLTLVAGDPEERDAGREGREALFVLGAEHGFVGSLNEAVVDAALAAVAKDPRTTVFLAGSRLAHTARERGLASETQLRLGTTVQGFERTARALTDLVARHLAQGELGRLVVLGPRRRGHGDWEVASDVIFPVPVEAGASLEPPLHYLPSRVLVAKLIEQFLFSRIAGAVAEAFLSEQIARVRAMEATRKNLDDKLEELRRGERIVRQEVITSELLEVVAGAEALEDGELAR